MTIPDDDIEFFFICVRQSRMSYVFVLQHLQTAGERPRLERFGFLTESKKMFMCEKISFILVASNLMIVNFTEMLLLLLFFQSMIFVIVNCALIVNVV